MLDTDPISFLEYAGQISVQLSQMATSLELKDLGYYFSLAAHEAHDQIQMSKGIKIPLVELKDSIAA